MTQNAPENLDLRVRRTRKLLQRALLELVVEKGFVAVSVQDICQRAMVNRATFYRHYLDKFDLLEHYMNEVYSLTEPQTPLVSSAQKSTPTAAPTVGVFNMFEHVKANADFFRVMLGKEGDPAFAQRIRQLSEQRLRTLISAERPPTQAGNPPLDLCLSYLSHAGIGGIIWWLNEGQATSAEEIARWLSQLNAATIERVLNVIL